MSQYLNSNIDLEYSSKGSTPKTILCYVNSELTTFTLRYLSGSDSCRVLKKPLTSGSMVYRSDDGLCISRNGLKELKGVQNSHNWKVPK